MQNTTVSVVVVHCRSKPPSKEKSKSFFLEAQKGSVAPEVLCIDSYCFLGLCHKFLPSSY